MAYPTGYATCHHYVSYELKKASEDCEEIELIPVSKIEAAFELYDTSEIWETPCPNCSSTKVKYLEHAHPKLDKEILDLWGNNDNYKVDVQDEEIVLAKIENLELILDGIDKEEYLVNKQIILIQTLCVLLYDYTVEPTEIFKLSENERNKIIGQVRPELIKRLNKIKNTEKRGIAKYYRGRYYKNDFKSCRGLGNENELRDFKEMNNWKEIITGLKSMNEMNKTMTQTIKSTMYNKRSQRS